MKIYSFVVKVDGRVCWYQCEADRLDRAIRDLADFANNCRCYRCPLHVCSVYDTYRIVDGIAKNSRRYGLRRKVPPILKLIHSSEFYLDTVETLDVKDFIDYSKRWNGY